MLILFDIDGTLLLSQRAGARAMLEAARELAGGQIAVEGLQFAGRLDPQIWADIAERNGLDGKALAAQLRSRYGQLLERHLQRQPAVRALPGVPVLLEDLRREPGVTLGILSGNFPETGRLKLQAAGIDPAIFAVGAWGSDGAVRRDLPAVAITRYRAHTGNEIQPSRVVIIGDTPNDIDCARASGCLAIGVATGSFTLEQLKAHDPNLVLEDLTATGEIVAWLRSGSASFEGSKKPGESS